MVEEEEDGVIYTVVVRQQHAAPNSPTVSPPQTCNPLIIITPGDSGPAHFLSLSLTLPLVVGVPLPVREGGDGGEAGAPLAPLVLYGRFLLCHHLPVHLPLLHLHQESAGHPH